MLFFFPKKRPPEYQAGVFAKADQAALIQEPSSENWCRSAFVWHKKALRK
jgi:hypothetical protein